MPPGSLQRHMIWQPPPVYPKLAWEARIQGTVRLAALIATDGTVERLELISGHPFLVEAAIDAVKQWRYRPWIDGDAPVQVMSEIDVPFSLGIRRHRPAVHIWRLRNTLPEARKPHVHAAARRVIVSDKILANEREIDGTRAGAIFNEAQMVSVRSGFACEVAKMNNISLSVPESLSLEIQAARSFRHSNHYAVPPDLPGSEPSSQRRAWIEVDRANVLGANPNRGSAAAVRMVSAGPVALGSVDLNRIARRQDSRKTLSIG